MCRALNLFNLSRRKKSPADDKECLCILIFSELLNLFCTLCTTRLKDLENGSLDIRAMLMLFNKSLINTYHKKYSGRGVDWDFIVEIRSEHFPVLVDILDRLNSLDGPNTGSSRLQKVEGPVPLVESTEVNKCQNNKSR